MKFTADRDIFLTALTTAYRAIPSKPLHLLADNFVFEFDDDGLIIVGSDSVTTLLVRVGAVIADDTSGRVVVHASTLLDFVKKLPDGPVTFDASKQIAVVRSEISQRELTLQLADASLYPKLPQPETIPADQWHTVSRELLIEALRSVVVAMPGDSTQQNLYMIDVKPSAQTDGTVFTTSDGSRLHRIDSAALNLPVMSISTLCVSQLVKALRGTDYEVVDVWAGKTGFAVKCGLDYAIFQAPTVKFPDVTKSILKPTLANTWKLYIDRDEFLRALMSVVVVSDAATQSVYIDVADGKMTLTAKNTYGTATSTLDVPWLYDPVKLVFRHKHLTDALRSYPSAQCDIRIANPKTGSGSAIRFVDSDSQFDAVVSQINPDLMK